MLFRSFFKLAAKEGLPQKQMDAAAIARAQMHRWPGNIRELENLVRRLAALYPQEIIGEALVDAELRGPEMDLASTPAAARAPAVAANAPPAPANVAAGDDRNLSLAVERYLGLLFRDHGAELPPPGLYHRILREMEVPLLSAALAATRGNQIKAAELLGVNRNTLRKKIRDLDVKIVRSDRKSTRLNSSH